MEDNKYFYQAEYASQGLRVQSLERSLKEAREKLKKQESDFMNAQHKFNSI